MSKKIGIGIAFCLIIIVVFSILIASICKFDYLPKISDPEQITLNFNDKQPANISKNQESSKEIYDNIVNKFKDSFKRSSLSYAFSGQSNANKVDVIDNNAFKNLKTEMKGYVVSFVYNKDGVALQNLENANTNFNEIIFEVVDSDEFKEIVLYFKQVGSGNFYYTFSTFAKFENLYDYLDEIKEITPTINN